MPRISDEHRQSMIQRIEDAALRCARSKGLAAMSMADIIKESDLSAGAIYGYYASKEELMLALARRVVGGRVAVMDELAARQPVPHPAEGLIEFMGTIDRSVREGGLVVQVWGMSIGSHGMGGISRESFNQLLEHLSHYLGVWYADARGMDAAQATAAGAKMAPSIMSLMQGWMFRAAIAGTEGDQEYVESVVALLRRL